MSKINQNSSEKSAAASILFLAVLFLQLDDLEVGSDVGGDGEANCKSKADSCVGGVQWGDLTLSLA
jgi:hypothetical protein